MNSAEIREVIEAVERARDRKEKPIGLSISVIAALLAIATILSHRAHTKEVVAQAEIVDDWSYYQAKHGRAHDYGRDAELALLMGGQKLALRDYNKSVEEQCGDPRTDDCNSPVENPDLLKALSAAGTAEVSEKMEQPEKATQHVVLKDQQKASVEKPLIGNKLGAVQLLSKVHDHEKKRDVIHFRADLYDIAVFLLELSIVLCSVSLLATSRIYWKISLLTALLGAVLVLYGSLAPPAGQWLRFLD